MSFRALSAAAHADFGEGAPLSPVRQFAAETKQQLLTTVARYHLLANVLYTMSFVVDWRSCVSSRTQRHDLVEDRGVQLGLGLGSRGEPTACVSNEAPDGTHFVSVYVHVLCVRRRVGRIGVL